MRRKLVLWFAFRERASPLARDSFPPLLYEVVPGPDVVAHGRSRIRMSERLHNVLWRDM